MKVNIFIMSLIMLCMSANSQKILKKGEYDSFKPGEKLEYTLKYGFIKGGMGELIVKEAYYKNEVVYHAILNAGTVGVVHALFNVKDIYESYFDKKTGLPMKAIRNIKEGGYNYYEEVLYERDSSQVKSLQSGIHKVPENILDMVSAFYYLRRMCIDTLEVNDIIKMETFFGDEVFPFYLRYKGVEKVKIKLGEFNCLRFDPIVEPGRMFESEDDMIMWISNDNNLIPIRVKFDLLVGSLKCDLEEYKNLKYDLKSLIGEE